MKNVSNNIEVKIANAEKIYTVLRGSDGMTKSQLAAKVGLSFASVSKMCTTLEQRELVRLKENARSTGGRKAARVSFNAEHAFTFVIDLHHTQHAYLGLVDLNNQIHKTVRFEVDPEDRLESILAKIQSSYTELVVNFEHRILGVCVGISAVHDPNTGILLQSSNPIFENVQLKRHLSEIFPDKVVLVDNDANLAGMSQMMNTEVAKKNLLFIFLTQGIGLGIMIDGKLYRGSNGFAGELGHIKVSGVSKKCKCGGIGCLRTVATLESIAQDLKELDMLHGTCTSAEYAASLSSRYTENDLHVIERVDLSAQKLGEVIAELFDLFNPQEIVLGGNMSALFPQLKQIMRDQCRMLSSLATAVDLQIRYVDQPTYELVLSGGAERMFQYWLETSFPKYPMP